MNLFSNPRNATIKSNEVKMFGAGNNVRALPAASGGDEEDSSSDEAEVGRFVRAPYLVPYGQRPDAQEEVDDDYADYSVTVPDYQKDLEDRVLELESVIKELRGTRREPPEDSPVQVVSTPTIPHIAPAVPPSPPSSFMSGGVIRWDNIKPFPKNVAATKMWEAWTRFIEDFEMAAYLSNLKDPKRRVELLLLSMGDELKSVVRAAKLRPSVEDEHCYSKFVDNIDKYLKAMTDPAAEHEDFSMMRQEEGESAVKFHARLTEKVLLCDYSPVDQDRFVRTQLLRGLRNQELKKAARTYAHDSNTIVQAATRAEAFQAEMVVTREEPNALVVSSSRFRGAEGQNKRGSAFHQTMRNPAKRFRSDRMPAYQPRRVSRRSRCSRCFESSHRGAECPALRRNCFSCGQRGHLAAACRVDRVSTVKDENSGIPMDENREQVKE